MNIKLTKELSDPKANMYKITDYMHTSTHIQGGREMFSIAR
jgi:hypothetical protein